MTKPQNGVGALAKEKRVAKGRRELHRGRLQGMTEKGEKVGLASFFDLRVKSFAVGRGLGRGGGEQCPAP